MAWGTRGKKYDTKIEEYYYSQPKALRDIEQLVPGLGSASDIIEFKNSPTWLNAASLLASIIPDGDLLVTGVKQLAKHLKTTRAINRAIRAANSTSDALVSRVNNSNLATLRNRQIRERQDAFRQLAKQYIYGSPINAAQIANNHIEIPYLSAPVKPLTWNDMLWFK